MHVVGEVWPVRSPYTTERERRAQLRRFDTGPRDAAHAGADASDRAETEHVDSREVAFPDIDIDDERAAGVVGIVQRFLAVAGIVVAVVVMARGVVAESA